MSNGLGDFKTAYPGTIEGVEGDQFGDQVDPAFPLGTKMSLPDGRLYRYAEMGGSVGVANKLYQAEVANAGWLAELVQGSIVVGDTDIGMENSSVAIVIDDFAEGYAAVMEAEQTGEYWIGQGNKAVASGAPGTLIDAFFFKPGVKAQVAVTDGANASLNFVKNLFMDIIIKPASDPTAPILGVPPSIIAANDWGWVQTMGVASCVYDATQEAALIGKAIAPDTTTAGAFMGFNADIAGEPDNGTIGFCLYVTTDEDFGLIYLQMGW